jgi:PAS domain S-box-containing protein
MSLGDTSHTERWAEEPFRLVADIAPVLMWILDASLGCTYVNQPLVAFSGRTSEALLGTGWRDGIHADDLARLLASLQMALVRREPFTIEARLRRHDGEYRWMRASGMPHVAADGTLIGYVGSCLDIDDVKRTQLALLRRDSELAEAQRLAAIGSWQWDQDTDNVTWSDELYRMVGLERGSNAIGVENHPKLYPPAHWERIARAAEEALRSGTPYELDVEMLIPDGSRKWITARGAVRRNEHGRIVGLHGTAQDITERRLAQQALLELLRGPARNAWRHPVDRPGRRPRIRFPIGLATPRARLDEHARTPEAGWRRSRDRLAAGERNDDHGGDPAPDGLAAIAPRGDMRIARTRPA